MSQEVALASVSSRIAGAVIDFCGARIGAEFHADDLRSYVIAQTGIAAPGSADRVLRDLRQRGALSYACTDRSRSLYFVHWVNPLFGLV